MHSFEAHKGLHVFSNPELGLLKNPEYSYLILSAQNKYFDLGCWNFFQKIVHKR